MGLTGEFQKTYTYLRLENNFGEGLKVPLF
jgi:hypothetical protein